MKKLFKNIRSLFALTEPSLPLDLPLSPDEVENLINKRIHRIDAEFKRGLETIKKYPKSVSILGSARFAEDNKYYKTAQELGKRIALETGYAVVTGGGPGIMEAANRGAFENGGKSLGMVIELPREQTINKYLTEYVEFHYFFTRKMVLRYSGEAYIFFPGGFGTMDEMFEIVTLVQTKKIPAVPIILMGTDFWTPLLTVWREKFLTENHTISPGDMDIFQLTDDIDQVISIIKQAPLRKE